MAYWELIQTSSYSVTVRVMELGSPFTKSNYKKIVFTNRDNGDSVLGTAFVGGTVNIEITPQTTGGNSLTSTLSGLAAGTSYRFYCYAQVNDAADGYRYYRIKGRSGGSLHTYLDFITVSVPQLTAPNEPTLVGRRFQWEDGSVDASIYLSGMTSGNAKYELQIEGDPELFGETHTYYFASGTSGDLIMYLSDLLGWDATPCTTYRMRLGAIDLNDSDLQAWSGWATLTTQPDNRSLGGLSLDSHLGYRHKGGAVTVRISSLAAHEFTYARIRVTRSGEVVGEHLLEKLNSEANCLTFQLPSLGDYTIELSVVYEVGSVFLYAVDSAGNTVVKSVAVSYRRPDYFAWTTEPLPGASVSSVSYKDWNALCTNVRDVIYIYKGRDDITIPPNDITLYGDMVGCGIYQLLLGTEVSYAKGIRINSDKTLYAWRYNSLNYIICCVENSDDETNVCNPDYSRRFVSGQPVYARYLTALSDKVNNID